MNPLHQTPRILVVDDNEMNIELLLQELEELGYDVTPASSGAECLAALASQSFDAVVLDVMMPGMSGLEVLERIRKTSSRTELPVIMASAKAENEDVVKALDLGANDYVVKPIVIPILVARLRVLVDIRARPATSPRNLELPPAETRLYRDEDPPLTPPSGSAFAARTPSRNLLRPPSGECLPDKLAIDRSTTGEFSGLDFEVETKLSVVRVMWRGFVAGEELRGRLGEALRTAQRGPEPRLLIDMAIAKAMARDDGLWFESWLSDVRYDGVSAVALVQPAHVIARMQLDRICERLAVHFAQPHGLMFRFQRFQALEEARAWLAEA